MGTKYKISNIYFQYCKMQITNNKDLASLNLTWLFLTVGVNNDCTMQKCLVEEQVIAVYYLLMYKDFKNGQTLIEFSY